MKLEEIKRLNAERTQGIWRTIYGESGMVQLGTEGGFKIHHQCKPRENAAFIAASPAMADMLVKLAEFEVTEGFVETVIFDEQAVFGSDIAKIPLEQLRRYAQAVIDHLREEIEG